MGRGALCPPPPPIFEARNLGKMREEFGQKVEEQKLRNDRKKSGKFTQKERNNFFIFKSIRLFVNNSQELARIFV